MAGYMWQAAEACRRGLSEPVDAVLLIEVYDDLSVATLDGGPICCEQLKHSEDRQGIGEDSPIWWLAIGAWLRCERPPTSKYRLVTTADLQPKSLLAACYQAGNAAPWEALLAAMDERASAAPNKDLETKGVYAAWLACSSAQRRELLTKVDIAHRQGRLSDANDKLDDALLKLGVSSTHVTKVRETYVGFFMSRLWASLDSGGFEIKIKELKHASMEAVARVMEPGRYEFPDLDFTQEDVDALQAEHHQHLVPQLHAIGRTEGALVARALESWYLARKRRQELMDGAPHEVHDLRRHDAELEDFCTTLHEEHGPADVGEDCVRVGRLVHAGCMKEKARLGVTEPPWDFSRGSYHELSNALRVRWHPKYGDI